MVVYPKISAYSGFINNISSINNEIDPSKIKPLILEKVIVKAKKLKEQVIRKFSRKQDK